ncbi:hypothetical protein OGAPHI_004949 [Ogataea philodendri]|uniref:Uncharacterized protein n=1 Tax=Ogataea philodendri TaxID=1378263 RepID=A0A9P8P0E6_9ASCO|nr:uncharacterized protein OGAPHI_004949 [Ogataea philodendri]KAH3663548.1 hypothetical protein OGAPHI_004949 [Ogataea philodendri]
MTLMNVASVLLATARAHKVLPVPGGPYNKIPFGGSIPNLTNLSGDNKGNSTTSLSFSICSLQPPTSLYVTSGFSSTVIIVTLGSILGGRGSWISYFVLSTPTLIPSSMSVGDTLSPNPTTNLAICLIFITYFVFASASSSAEGSIILVHRATCNGCSSLILFRSAATSHKFGLERPVSDSSIPIFSLIRPSNSFRSFSMSRIDWLYGAAP